MRVLQLPTTVLPLLLLAVLSPVLAADGDAPATSLRLHHRIYHPSLPSEPFTPRGELLLSTGSSPGLGLGVTPASSISVNLVPAPALEAELSAFAAATQNIAYDRDAALYQLALEHPGDTHHSQWHVSAVKACHALTSTAETLTLHLAADGTAFALDYFVAPTPHNGACPKSYSHNKSSKKHNSHGGKSPVTDSASGTTEPVRAWGGLTNSTVLVRAATAPPLPQLRTPPPLTTEGKPLEAPAEKSFLQKYWIYLVVGLLALALSPGGEDKEEGQGEGQGRQR